MQPKLNPFFARYIFNDEIQGSDTIDNFVTRLRIRPQKGEFKEKDNMIRDRIVFGCSSTRMREKLINEGNKLTMDKAMQVFQNFEYWQQQLSSMTISYGPTLMLSTDVRTPPNLQRRDNRVSQNRDRRVLGESKKQIIDTCGNCGTGHAKNKCPVHDKICHARGKKIITSKCAGHQ